MCDPQVQGLIKVLCSNACLTMLQSPKVRAQSALHAALLCVAQAAGGHGWPHVSSNVCLQAYDAVDLDPYGTPAQLVDSAVQVRGLGPCAGVACARRGPWAASVALAVALTLWLTGWLARCDCCIQRPAQSVAEGGLLLVTATDMANLCGNNR